MSTDPPTRKASSKSTTGIRKSLISSSTIIVHEPACVVPYPGILQVDKDLPPPPPPKTPEINRQPAFSEGFSPLESHSKHKPSSFGHPHTPTPSKPTTPDSELVSPVRSSAVVSPLSNSREEGQPSLDLGEGALPSPTFLPPPAIALEYEDPVEIPREIADKPTELPTVSAIRASQPRPSSYYPGNITSKEFNVKLDSGLSIYNAANQNPHSPDNIPVDRAPFEGF
jgi:hypothetical protein